MLRQKVTQWNIVIVTFQVIDFFDLLLGVADKVRHTAQVYGVGNIS